MIRHPFYFLCCASAVAYLSVANARGWSFWHSILPPASQNGGSGGHSSYYGGFNHK